MKALFILFVSALGASAIEKPDYETILQEGKFEIRKYEAIKVVSAPMDDMQERNDSFRKLFKYISGENANDQKIAMTAPVFMDDKGENEGTMSFMIPAEIAEAGAPAPNEEGLEVTEVEGGTYAVLRFKGWKDEEKQAEATAKLAELVAAQNLKPIGEHFFAFYDAPWKPEMFRRNEVWQRVTP
ncbi:MAG: SOUL family heme-binding protein [Luteolibacter sp.]